MSKRIEPSTIQTNSQSGISTFLRVYWLLAWVFPMFLLVKLGFESKTIFYLKFIWLLSPLSMVIARYIDIVKDQGATTEGNPATMDDFKKYCIFVFFISLFATSFLYFMK